MVVKLLEHLDLNVVPIDGCSTSKFIRGKVKTTPRCHMVWHVTFSIRNITCKKLQDDGKMATTTLPPATHFPDILSNKQKHLEAKILPKPGR